MLFLGSLLFYEKVNAEEFYYQNNFGVQLNLLEYNFITDMYWNGYQEYITQQDYDEIKELDLFTNKVTKEIVTNFPLHKGSSVTGNLRTLTIAKSCTSDCMVSLVNSWNGTPTIKSFDVIGARIVNANITSIKNALVTGTGYGKAYSNPKMLSNGFGYSILVPNVSNIKTSVTFYTTKGGTAYGSYQHAMINTTEVISKQYNSLSSLGYGKVFDFNGTSATVYDRAPGVDISL